MECNSCGAQVPPGQRFCGQCGAPVAEKAETGRGGPDQTLDDLIGDYRKELEDRPDDTNIKYNLAMALEQRGRFDEALGLLRQIQGKEPVQGDIRRVERKVVEREA